MGHREDVDGRENDDIMWVIGEIPVPTENAKELERWMCEAMPKMEAEEPGTLFYNMLGPFKVENGVSYYYQIDAYKGKEGLGGHKTDHLVEKQEQLCGSELHKYHMDGMRIMNPVGKSYSKRFGSYYPPGAAVPKL